MNAQDKNDEKQQRPDGGYWAEPRNDPGATNGAVSGGQGKPLSSSTTAGSPTDDDSNLTGTDLQPGDQSEQEHGMHMSGQRYDAAGQDPSRGPTASQMKDDEKLFDEGQATTPGTSGQPGGPEAANASSSSAKATAGTASGSHGAASGGSGTGDAGALSHEVGAPGLAGGTSASGTPDEAEGDVTLGSGGTGAGLPDGNKGN